jgi:RNA polymerase sporulation-specific sigma factor
MDFNSAAMLRSLPDEKLVTVLADQPQAFDILLERYRHLIAAIAKAHAVNAADAEDYVQEGMLGLLAAASSYAQDRSAGFRTYAAVCIRNRIRNVSGKEHAASRRGNDFSALSLDDPENQTAELLADSDESPEDVVLEKELISELYAKLADVLSRQEQEIFWLSVNGFSYADIADRLHISAKSVDNAIQRARRKLRAIWSALDMAAIPVQNQGNCP